MGLLGWALGGLFAAGPVATGQIVREMDIGNVKELSGCVKE